MRQLARFGVWCLGMVVAAAGCQPGNQAPGVILLRYNPGSESTEKREQGFLETLRNEFPRIPILSSDQYGGTTPEMALDKAQQMLLKYGEQTAGIFAVCEPNATGVLGALDDLGLAGKVKFIGFDPNPKMVEALSRGAMHGIVLQDPVRMGYLAVKAMVDHLEGRPVEKRISTGEFMATLENMKTPDIDRLLHPKQHPGDDDAVAGSVKYTIAVIPKGTTHEFWKSVHAGAAGAARELGNTRIIWKGPLLESDRDGQISVVQDFTTRKVSGIVLAPLDSQALVPAVRDAKAEGIPTVIFDSGLADQSLVVSYVATDNFQGGVLAARRMAEVLGPSSP